MNYPFWDIPHLGSGWVIGLIAIFHVMISQFAVGGGLYLPMAERKAMRMAEGIRAGQVYVNATGIGTGVELPFGGYGHSGWGREKGLEGLASYLQTKNVCIGFGNRP